MKKDNAQILSQCLADIRSGRLSLEQSLALYPEIAAEIRPLLEIALNIKPDDVAVSEHFKQRARQRLWQEMDKSPRGFSFRLPPFLAGLRPLASLRSLAIILPLVVVFSFGSIAYASRSSLPGDTLFKLKTGLENARLAVAFDPAQKNDLRLALVERRVDEVIRLDQLGQPVSQTALDCLSVCLENVLYQDTSQNPEQIALVLERFTAVAEQQKEKLETRVKSTQSGSSSQFEKVIAATQFSLYMAAAAEINSRVLDVKMPLNYENEEEEHFSLTGLLVKDITGYWLINGQELRKVHFALSAQPVEGENVKIEGINVAGETYIIEIEPVNGPGNNVPFENEEQELDHTSDSGEKMESDHAGPSVSKPTAGLAVNPHPASVPISDSEESETESHSPSGDSGTAVSSDLAAGTENDNRPEVDTADQTASEFRLDATESVEHPSADQLPIDKHPEEVESHVEGETAHQPYNSIPPSDSGQTLSPTVETESVHESDSVPESISYHESDSHSESSKGHKSESTRESDSEPETGHTD